MNPSQQYQRKDPNVELPEVPEPNSWWDQYFVIGIKLKNHIMVIDGDSTILGLELALEDNSQDS